MADLVDPAEEPAEAGLPIAIGGPGGPRSGAMAEGFGRDVGGAGRGQESQGDPGGDQSSGGAARHHLWFAPARRAVRAQSFLVPKGGGHSVVSWKVFSSRPLQSGLRR